MVKYNRDNWFSKMMIWGIISATIISLFFAYFCDVIFYLNDNQLLYVFSTMAQVTGGLFGLTLTAYVYFADKFKESTRGDDILYDATMSILTRHFYNLILIGVTCGIVICLCIFGIVDMNTWIWIYSFVINEGVLLFIVLIVAILIFGIMLLDPKKLDKEVARLKEDAEKYYQSNTNEEGDFREFLKTYNMLEQLLIKFAQACMIDNNWSIYNNRPQIIQSLKVLIRSEIVNYILVDEINELRMYRNALVHGIDFSINQEVCNRILKIYETLNGAFEVYKGNGRNSEEWQRAINKVYNLSVNERN